MSAAASRTHGSWRYWMLIAPALLLMLLFYIYPIGKVFWISVTDPSPGIDNYLRLGTSTSIQRMLVTTARISLISTAITLLLAYLVSYVLATGSARMRGLMLLGVLVPLWISVLVRAFAWIVILRREGLVNTALLGTGLIDQPLDLVWNELGVTIGIVHYMIPFGVLPLYASMRDIDPKLIGAARGLGASRGTAFRRILLPLSMPGIVGAGILVFIFSLGFFVTPALLGGGRTLMIAEYIKVQILDVVRWGDGTMLAMTLLVVVSTLLLGLSRMVDLRRLFGSA